MCGRFALHLARQEAREPRVNARVQVNGWVNEERYIPRYNIAPRTHSVVMLPNTMGEPIESSSSAPLNVTLHTMKWGLVPHWSKHEDLSKSTMNARSDVLIEGGGMWQSIKGRNRCAVVVQGYYEWLTKGKEKIPHFFKHDDGKLMLFAGLYDSVLLEGQQERLWTFTIVTTDAAGPYEWLHCRQPVILQDDEQLRSWLDTSKGWHPGLFPILQPYSGPQLAVYQVPKEMGKVGTESPAFIEPVSERKDGIESMFKKQIARSPSKNTKSPPSSPTKREEKMKSEVIEIDDIEDVKDVKDEGSPSTEPASQAEDKSPNASQEKGTLKVPSTPTAKRTHPTDFPSSPSPSKKARKGKNLDPDGTSSKITSFFAKK
ncbi:DUF159-domain-containing protein [Sistotremastrum niveocremeum HHB9708]|uniref:DUF159-domain-containing protein n=1 Tax=Sistotremastrum niveocremeum HHB9708 TaxID=1314777 RepID=A0A164Q6P5_9AGAM|nr:DUF159-domain-containing protein [Sistotremastrum niveocremeum HHB9708]